MRFHLGEIPDSPDFVPDRRWTRVREPTPWGMQGLALLLGLAMATVFLVLWVRLTPVGRAPAPSLYALLAALVAMVLMTRSLRN